MLYIAYGSNLHRCQMARRCPGAKAVGSTTRNGYRLLFRGDDGSAVATIEPEEGCRVPVLLWEISDHNHLALDRYEGGPPFMGKSYAL